MKTMGGGRHLLATLAVALPCTLSAVQIRNQTAARVAAYNVSGAGRDTSAMVAVPIPMLVVREEDVPALQVLHVDDAGRRALMTSEAAGASGAGARNDAMASPANSLAPSDACQEEMFKNTMNRSQLDRAHICEQKAGHVERAVRALQSADEDAALNATAANFHECAGISSRCAKEAAPSVLVKLRMSGAAVSDHCVQVAKNATGHYSGRCLKASTKAMMTGLQRMDIARTLEAARVGLAACKSIESPCDYQLAPTLVMHMMQAVEVEEEQELATFMLSGLHMAQQLAGAILAKAAAAAPKADDNHSSKNTTKPASKAMPKKKAPISLLSINERLHISFKQHLAKL